MLLNELDYLFDELAYLFEYELLHSSKSVEAAFFIQNFLNTKLITNYNAKDYNSLKNIASYQIKNINNLLFNIAYEVKDFKNQTDGADYQIVGEFENKADFAFYNIGYNLKVPIKTFNFGVFDEV